MIYENSETLVTKECESTQTEVKKNFERLGSPASQILWLLAKRQSKGRGRRERKWIDPQKGHPLFISAAFKWPKEHQVDPLITLLAGYSLFESTQDMTQNSNFFLKWPNDLCVINNQVIAKIAGVLVEMKGDVIVVGWGVNINSTPELKTSSSLLDPSSDNAVYFNNKLELTLKKKFLTLLNNYFEDTQIFKSKIIPKLEIAMRPMFDQKIKINNELCVVQKLEEDGSLIVVDSKGVEKKITSADVQMIVRTA